MDMRHPADYAYHNCEFHSAIALIGQTGSIYEDLAVLHIKSLCELDLAENALAQSDRYLENFPESGQLHYLLGTAKYLARRDLSQIESSFMTATKLGFSGGPVGIAFVEFARGNIDHAIAAAASATQLDPEMEHIRCLISAQLWIAKNDVPQAESWLQKADRVLNQFPSLLRQYWGQLCWIRLLRAKGLFDSARIVSDRTIDQLCADIMPRLHRNAIEAKRMIEAQSGALNIVLPPASKSQQVEVLPSEITSRPMLLAFYQHLQACGKAGASKEDLAGRVWEESYNPTIHDTRIYKTVARLRKLLGDHHKHPARIIQVGRQYVLHPAKEGS